MSFEEGLEILISPFLFFTLCEVFQKNQYINYKVRLLLEFGNLLMKPQSLVTMHLLLEMFVLAEDSLTRDINGNM